MEDTDPARQHVIANALLARRKRHMVHLKNETYVDTSLITCAEYQVFLDEARGQGRFVQPDHWTSSRFAPGWGKQPILGVHLSDAEAFCTWLTERDAALWSYRLPKKGELEQESNVLHGSPMNTSYWLNDKAELSWVSTPLMLPDALFQEAANPLPDYLFDYLLTRSHTLALDLDRILARPLAPVLAPTLTPDLAPVITHDLVLARDLAHVLARAHILTHDLARDCILALDLDRTLARYLPQDLSRAISIFLDRDINFDLDRNLPQSRLLMVELVMAVCRASIIYFYTDWNQRSSNGRLQRRFSRGRSTRLVEKGLQNLVDTLLDMYLDLFILKKRIQGELPACEGILLVKERK